MHLRAAVISGVLACAATLPFAGTAFAQDRDCPSFATQAEAQAFFESQGSADPHRLDADDDGVACENNSSEAPSDSGSGEAPSDSGSDGDGGQDQGVTPSGGVETGRGGMADNASDSAWQWGLTGAALLTAGGVVAVRHRRVVGTN